MTFTWNRVFLLYTVVLLLLFKQHVCELLPLGCKVSLVVV